MRAFESIMRQGGATALREAGSFFIEAPIP